MARNNKLLEEAKKLVGETDTLNIHFAGSKPWFERSLTKFKFGLMAGLATGLVSGLSAFGVIKTDDLKFDVQKEVAQVQMAAKTIEPIKPITKISVPIQKSEFDNSVEALKKQYPNVSFENVSNQRDVSKQFIGNNNFIALAAEMEGFRGDLHKDPATGLNIGFGYNITKRAQASKTEVVKDLISIGIPNDQVHQIIEMSQKPQGKLTQEIAQFNKTFNLKDKNLITIEQGVALLKRTQNEYKEQARASFPNSFDKMAKNQQEVLTYAAYKAGFEALSKYKKFAKAAENVYSKTTNPNIGQLKNIAKELHFYYMKDGKEMVLDERAALIAHTFVHQDYLGVQIGHKKSISLSPEKLANNKIDFSHLNTTVVSKNDAKTDKVRDHDVKKVLEQMRDDKKGHKVPKYG